jgi:hypothetical protein
MLMAINGTSAKAIVPVSLEVSIESGNFVETNVLIVSSDISSQTLNSIKCQIEASRNINLLCMYIAKSKWSKSKRNMEFEII